jgi:hypothetical protein
VQRRLPERTGTTLCLPHIYHHASQLALEPGKLLVREYGQDPGRAVPREGGGRRRRRRMTPFHSNALSYKGLPDTLLESPVHLKIKQMYQELGG